MKTKTSGGLAQLGHEVIKNGSWQQKRRFYKAASLKEKLEFGSEHRARRRRRQNESLLQFQDCDRSYESEDNITYSAVFSFKDNSSPFIDAFLVPLDFTDMEDDGSKQPHTKYDAHFEEDDLVHLLDVDPLPYQQENTCPPLPQPPLHSNNSSSPSVPPPPPPPHCAAHGLHLPPPSPHPSSHLQQMRSQSNDKITLELSLPQDMAHHPMREQLMQTPTNRMSSAAPAFPPQVASPVILDDFILSDIGPQHTTGAPMSVASSSVDIGDDSIAPENFEDDDSDLPPQPKKPREEPEYAVSSTPPAILRKEAIVRGVSVDSTTSKSSTGASANQVEPVRRVRQNWTKEEDDRLRYAMEKYGRTDLENIAKYVCDGGRFQRTEQQCRARIFKVMRVKSGQRTGRWSREEFDLLLELRNAHPNASPKDLAVMLKTRNEKQVKEKLAWHYYKTNARPWTQAELDELLALVDEKGRQWSWLAQRLDRYYEDVKNTYNRITKSSNNSLE